MNKRLKLFLSISIVSIATSATTNTIEPPYSIIYMDTGDIVRLEGFVDYRGEVILYSSRDAKYKQLVFPYCVSGYSSISSRKIEAFGNERVIVSAEVFDIERPSSDESIYTHVYVSGKPIKNWCFGSRALMIDDIEKVK